MDGKAEVGVEVEDEYGEDTNMRAAAAAAAAVATNGADADAAERALNYLGRAAESEYD